MSDDALYKDEEMVHFISLPTKMLDRELRNHMKSLDILERTEGYTEASRKIIEVEKARLKEKIRKMRTARAERERLHLH